MIKAPPTAFRAHNFSWAHKPTSGDGAAIWGGRFNRVGQPTLYLSLDEATALLETDQGFPKKRQPTTLIQYDVDCEDIVDLTDEVERSNWAISEADLNCGWEDLAERKQYVPSWAVSDRLQIKGAAGMLVRSFAPGAAANNVNLVLWKWGPDLPHRVTAIDDEGRLTRPPTIPIF